MEHKKFRSQNCRSCSMITLKFFKNQHHWNWGCSWFCFNNHPPNILQFPTCHCLWDHNEGDQQKGWNPPGDPSWLRLMGLQKSHLLKMQMETPHVARVPRKQRTLGPYQVFQSSRRWGEIFRAKWDLARLSRFQVARPNYSMERNMYIHKYAYIYIYVHKCMHILSTMTECIIWRSPECFSGNCTKW